MKKPRFGGDGRSSREDAEREAQEELNRLTRRSGPPPSRGGAPAAPASPPARSSYSPPRSSYAPPPAPPSSTRSRGAGTARSSAAPPAEARSPGFGGRVPVAGDEDEFDDDYAEDEGDDVYHGPRSAKEEEEAVTGLALRDWAAGRGQADRLEDFALPRLDAPSIEAQRDRALREIMERQERMQKEYRDQKARFEPAEGSPEVSDLRAAHQMDVLRRGKPAGMMNMAAVQTGAFNRQRRERLAAAETLEASQPAPVSARSKAKKAAATGKAPKATTAKAPAARAAKAAARTTRPVTEAVKASRPRAVKAPVSKAAKTPAVKRAVKAPVSKVAKTPVKRAVKAPVSKVAKTPVKRAAPAAKAAPKKARPAAKTPRRG